MGRTYESKLVSREMHRLGNFAYLNPAPFTHPPSSSTGLPQSSGSPWGALTIHVSPSLDGEVLRVPVQVSMGYFQESHRFLVFSKGLNTLRKRHIQSVVSAAPLKAKAPLEYNTSALILSGMVILSAKLTGMNDDKLISRVVETLGFLWDQVPLDLERVSH